MTTFILIHGGLHGGWCWEHVVPRLEAAGHKALAPNLPGMGGDPTPLEETSLAGNADFIADLVRRQGEPAVLVAHSMGGITMSEAAERVPERLRGLIYVVADLVPGGMTMGESGHPELVSTARDVMTSPDGSVAYGFAPEIAIEVFYNRTDRAVAERAIARLTPQPLAAMAQPLSVTPERFGRVPRAYVECLDDHAVPLSMQRREQKALPCDPVVTMDSDHSPFLCAPEELTRHLIAIAETFPRVPSYR